MKKFLMSLISKKEKEVKDLRAKVKSAETADEVRALGETLDAVLTELQEAKDKLAELDEQNDDGSNGDGDGSNGEGNDDEGEGNDDNNQRGGFNPMRTFQRNKMNGGKPDDVAPTATMEYRKAFMAYVQRGEMNKDVLQFEKRADATGTSTDLGILIPETVIQEIIKGVEKVYGQLYSRVKKTNVPGGVKYPIGAFTATFNRIAETGKSDRQDAGGATGSVTFTYNVGEIRLARTLLQTVLSVPVFEQELAKVIVEAYVKAMDTEIMTGVAANNQCEGILTEAAKQSSRIQSGNIITFTAEEMADWTEWQTKLFAKIPLSMRALRPQFVMTSDTYESNIKTLKDNNNRPLYVETFNPIDGSEVCTFKGKEVVLVEDDILENFNDAENNEYFGMYWVPESGYAINSNMQFTVRDYFDEETNQFVKKALVINDGKILDPKYIYLLKKSITG